MTVTDHEADVWPEDRLPDRFGVTVACGEQRHDTCPGVRVWDREPWGPCTCHCHGVCELQVELERLMSALAEIAACNFGSSPQPSRPSPSERTPKGA